MKKTFSALLGICVVSLATTVATGGSVGLAAVAVGLSGVGLRGASS